MSTSYSSQTHGLVEKIKCVRNYLENGNQTRWSYFLKYVTLAYNATPQTTTKFSPFYLMHGFEPYFPVDNKIIPDGMPYDIEKALRELLKIRDNIPKQIESAQLIQKKYHDQKHRTISYKEGDLVMI